eukprot:SAG22_NODE_465_length_10181_cov_6.604444_13_plen_62_part_00
MLPLSFILRQCLAVCLQMEKNPLMDMVGLECTHAMPLGSLLSWALTTPVQLYVGITFYRRE